MIHDTRVEIYLEWMECHLFKKKIKAFLIHADALLHACVIYKYYIQFCNLLTQDNISKTSLLLIDVLNDIPH